MSTEGPRQRRRASDVSIGDVTTAFATGTDERPLPKRQGLVKPPPKEVNIEGPRTPHTGHAVLSQGVIDSPQSTKFSPGRRGSNTFGHQSPGKSPKKGKQKPRHKPSSMHIPRSILTDTTAEQGKPQGSTHPLNGAYLTSPENQGITGIPTVNGAFPGTSSRSPRVIPLPVPMSPRTPRLQRLFHRSVILPLGYYSIKFLLHGICGGVLISLYCRYMERELSWSFLNTAVPLLFMGYMIIRLWFLRHSSQRNYEAWAKEKRERDLERKIAQKTERRAADLEEQYSLGREEIMANNHKIFNLELKLQKEEDRSRELESDLQDSLDKRKNIERTLGMMEQFGLLRKQYLEAEKKAAQESIALPQRRDTK